MNCAAIAKCIDPTLADEAAVDDETGPDGYDEGTGGSPTQTWARSNVPYMCDQVDRFVTMLVEAGELEKRASRRGTNQRRASRRMANQMRANRTLTSRRRTDRKRASQRLADGSKKKVSVGTPNSLQISLARLLPPPHALYS